MRRITYANVVSTVALFIAVGGGAWAVAAPRPDASAAKGGATRVAVLKACVDNVGGIVHQRTGKTCAANQKKVSFGFAGGYTTPSGAYSLSITDAGGIVFADDRDPAKKTRITMQNGSVTIGCTPPPAAGTPPGPVPPGTPQPVGRVTDKVTGNAISSRSAVVKAC